MKDRTLLSLFLIIAVLCSASSLLAQEPTAEQEERVAEIEENLKYDDFTVKAYTLTFFGGNFSGATYLDNPILADNTVLADGANNVMGYDGHPLHFSYDEFGDGGGYRYQAAQKKIEPGPAFGGRVGIYISRDFHLDLHGTYAQGNAITTMIGHPDTLQPINNPDVFERITLDEDKDFKMVKGGLALMYDAKSATLFGLRPHIGFGLGGIINRYSMGLPDKTALYLEGNLGLSYEVFDNFRVSGQVDLTTFAYEVDELGYSNMVNYATFTMGVSWFMDVVPGDVRAAHLAELRAAKE